MLDEEDTETNDIGSKVIYIYMNNEACKCMLINMQAKLSLTDLQLIISEMCKICLQLEIIP